MAERKPVVTESMAWVSVWWVRDVAVSVLVVVGLEGGGKVVGVRWVVGFWLGKHILIWRA